ncbi:Os02g0675550 [Oryza sativa Japonica Group]|uniref:Os02g0675550 protein n=1 Tax=Oryza sativa subsp. japonica TaxID=39947 RepID=A0A0N7KFV4_ORYSJ|nr:hypothetical protein EE612_012975 [Oryza sativa]BAS80265.1 Os02g0675550 [Oryza sativa Japonica Group]
MLLLRHTTQELCHMLSLADAERERQRRGLEAGEEEDEHEVERDALRQHGLLPPQLLDQHVEEVLALPPRLLHPLPHHLLQHLHRVPPPLHAAKIASAVPGMSTGNEMSPRMKATKFFLRFSDDFDGS